MKNKSGIIYTLNRKTTEERPICYGNGIKAVAYHAGLDSKHCALNARTSS